MVPLRPRPELAPPLVLGRVGFDVGGAPSAVLPAIPSTEVRAQVAAGRWEELGPLVPRKVLDYLRTHPLYAG